MSARRNVGGYSEGDHLLPFRTEKLSPSALMVLPLGGRVGRRQPKFKAHVLFKAWAFFVPQCSAQLPVISIVYTNGPDKDQRMQLYVSRPNLKTSEELTLKINT